MCAVSFYASLNSAVSMHFFIFSNVTELSLIDFPFADCGQSLQEIILVSPQFECVLNILKSSNISLYWMTLGIPKVPENIILVNSVAW